jgi:hypothetical protein
MSGIERRIDALEKQLGQESHLLWVSVNLDESDDDAIKRAATIEGVALKDVAAAVLFYRHAAPLAPTESEEARIEWAKKYCKPPKTVYLRLYNSMEQAAIVRGIRASVDDALKRLAAEEQERHRAAAPERNQEE